MSLTSDDIAAADHLRRLERRLEREREARLAAEAIAEKGIRDLYTQQQRLGLLETIAVAANLDDDPEVTFRLALQSICEFTGWTNGQVYMFPDDAPESTLIYANVTFGMDDERIQPFRELSAAISFPRGTGLPGRVWESGKACWIEDVGNDANFPRAPVAVACGLHGAFAFPALIGEEVGAVLEFFLHRPAPPQEALLRTLDQIGAQLGRVIERYRHARRAAADHAALEAMYAEAQAQRMAAEQASQAKSAFLAVTSHEIRTPLNAVLGLAEALRREPLTPRQAELNDGVLDSGAMLLRLLNAVLDMSRIEAGQATASMGDFDIEARVRAIASIWTPRAQETGVTLTVSTEGLALTRLHSDEGRIEQTLVNLVSNALKFTPRGGRVHVHAVSSEDRLRLEVIDSGPGVPEADRERIFHPFEQTEAGRSAGGAGLGLAICVGNVRLLDGDIGTDRTTGGESRFWFECPVSPPKTCASTALPGTAAPPPGLRVLAAEDNAGNRRVLEVLLAPAGVDLVVVEDGSLAVEAVKEQTFDLILMDANMPVMDGLEAVRRIRAGGRHAGRPIHMLTANAFAEDVARYMAAGADGVLTKPIQLPQLFAVLAACGSDPASEVAA